MSKLMGELNRPGAAIGDDADASTDPPWWDTVQLLSLLVPAHFVSHAAAADAARDAAWAGKISVRGRHLGKGKRAKIPALDWDELRIVDMTGLGWVAWPPGEPSRIEAEAQVFQMFAGGISWVDREYDERLGEVLRPVDHWTDLMFSADAVVSIWPKLIAPDTAAGSARMAGQKPGGKTRGPRPERQRAIIERMVSDYAKTHEELAVEKQEVLARKYNAARSTVEKARKTARDRLMETSTNSDK